MGRTLAINEQSKIVKPEHYSWFFPGAPIKVHLDLDVVEHLQEQVRHATAASVECGLLFGSAAHGTVEIHEFERHASNEALKQAITAAKKDGRRAIVGYYRVHREDTLRLGSEDVLLAEEYFRDPQQVILLIQPTDFGPSNASFFFWDEGRLNGDVSFLEFPFDAELLGAVEQQRAAMAQRKALARPVRVEEPAPIPASVPTSPPHRGSFFRRAVWIAGILFVLAAAALTIGLRLYPEKLATLLTTIPPTPPPRATSFMDLQAERQNGDVKLTWNRNSSVISDATSALLSIEDGPVKREIHLDALQVHGGSILYTPISDEVQMQLAVVDPAATAVESVIVVLPATGPARVQPLSSQSASAAPRPQAPASQEPLKPFTAPDAPQVKPQAPVIEEPPALRSAPAAAPAGTDLLNRTLVGSVPQPVASDIAASPAQQSLRVAPVYHPPVALNQVLPSIPAALSRLLLKPTAVQIQVTINEAGKVTQAVALPPLDSRRYLVDGALHAARQWRFKPALRGDQPVPSEMVITFKFERPQ